MISYPSLAQFYDITGFIVDSLGNSISFATIEVIKDHNGIGVVANENGEFQLTIPQDFTDDTLTVSALGYYTQKFAIAGISNRMSMNFELHEKTYDLSEIVILPGPTTLCEYGNSKLSKWTGGMLTENLTQIAVYIKNRKSEKGTLKDISFFITRSGKPKAPVRIRIYDFNTEDDPIGSDLLQETVIFKPNKKFGWNAVDLSSHNIEFPEDGLFVAIESIVTKKKYRYKTKIQGQNYDHYGIVIGNTWQYEVANTYKKRLGYGWTKVKNTSIENKPRNALIKATFKLLSN